MKKIALLTSLVTLAACVPTAPTDTVPDVNNVDVATEAQEQPKEQTIQEVVKEIDAAMSAARTPLGAAWLYSTTYFKENTNICQSGDIPWSGVTSGEEYENQIEAFQVLTTSDITVKCFLKNAYEDYYYDSSDDCILARRKAKDTKTCYYDYKRYLPADTKISNDTDFLYLVKAYNALYKDLNNPKECTYCENLLEHTTAEKEECTKKAEKFLGQISSKTVPLCKNSVKSEYMQFLKEGVEEFSFLSNMTKAEINSSVSSASKAYLLNGIYASAYEEAWENAIQNFGFTHFCSVSGYQNDIVNINKTNKKRINNVVSLN